MQRLFIFIRILIVFLGNFHMYIPVYAMGDIPRTESFIKLKDFRPIRYFRNKVNTIDDIGDVELNEAQVETFVWRGRANAYRARFGTFHVMGDIRLNYGCVIKERSFVDGSIKSFGSIFNKKISIKSNRALFDSSQLQDIHMLKTADSRSRIQRIELKNNSHVYGAIKFESNNGQVCIYDTSNVHCKVEGGSIVYKK